MHVECNSKSCHGKVKYVKKKVLTQKIWKSKQPIMLIFNTFINGREVM